MKTSIRSILAALLLTASSASAAEISSLQISCDGSRYGNVDAPYFTSTGEVALAKLPQSPEEKVQKVQKYAARGFMKIKFGSFWVGIQSSDAAAVQGILTASQETGVTLGLQMQIESGVASQSGALDLSIRGDYSSMSTDGSKSYRSNCSLSAR